MRQLIMIAQGSVLSPPPSIRWRHVVRRNAPNALSPHDGKPKPPRSRMRARLFVSARQLVSVHGKSAGQRPRSVLDQGRSRDDSAGKIDAFHKSGFSRSDKRCKRYNVLVVHRSHDWLHQICLWSMARARFQIVELSGNIGWRAARQWRSLANSAQIVAMTRGARDGNRGVGGSNSN